MMFFNVPTASKKQESVRPYIAISLRAAAVTIAACSLLRASANMPTVTLATSSSSVVYGKPLVLTATVAASNATGVVTFFDGVSIIGTSKLANGHAYLTTGQLTSGPHTLKAYYGGDATYAASSSGLIKETVSPVPGGGFPTAASFPTSQNPVFVATGDLNGDGKADLVTANNTNNGELSILLGNGDGTFQKAGSIDYCCGSVFVTISDLNGDGKADLVVVRAARYPV